MAAVAAQLARKKAELADIVASLKEKELDRHATAAAATHTAPAGTCATSIHNSAATGGESGDDTLHARAKRQQGDTDAEKDGCNGAEATKGDDAGATMDCKILRRAPSTPSSANLQSVAAAVAGGCAPGPSAYDPALDIVEKRSVLAARAATAATPSSASKQRKQLRVEEEAAARAHAAQLAATRKRRPVVRRRRPSF